VGSLQTICGPVWWTAEPRLRLPKGDRRRGVRVTGTADQVRGDHGMALSKDGKGREGKLHLDMQVDSRPHGPGLLHHLGGGRNDPIKDANTVHSVGSNRPQRTLFPKRQEPEDEKSGAWGVKSGPGGW